jgi:hypothetical protein
MGSNLCIASSTVEPLLFLTHKNETMIDLVAFSLLGGFVLLMVWEVSCFADGVVG